MADNAMYFSGDLYLNRKNSAGVSEGLRKLGNASQFQVTVTSTTKELKSKMRATYNQNLAVVTTIDACKVAMTLNQSNEDNSALANMGDKSAVTQSAASSKTKDFDLSAVDSGIYYELGDRIVSVSGVAISGTPMEEGTYELDEDGGLIAFTDTAPSSGTATVSYSVNAAAGHKITGATNPSISGQLLFLGINLVTREKVRIEIYDAAFTVKSSQDYLSENYNEVQYEGSLNTPSGQNSPFEIITLKQAA